jgi:error-prone DNA polymerase
VSFLRRRRAARRILTCAALGRCRNGAQVEVAGLVLVRQRPGTATGVVFATLEDETGIANIVIWKDAFERHRPTIVAARLLAVRGKVQVEGLVVHVIAEGFTDLTGALVALGAGADADAAAARQVHAALPQGRNFR